MKIKNMLARLLAVILLGAALLTPLSGAAFAAEWDTSIQLANNDYEPNVIIIKFKDPGQIPANKHKQYNDEIDKVEKWGFKDEYAGGYYIVKIDELEKNMNAALNRFKNSGFIEYVEPNYIGSFDLAPSDPAYQSNGSAAAKNINAEAGWSIAVKSDVKIAIVDSGYGTNSDLPAASGYSVFNKNTDLSDKVGHGTQVSGTVCARANNGLGNAGVVWEANILPIKVSETPSVSVANVAAAINYAADNNAKIINLSLSFTSDSVTLKNAVDNAFKKGCILIAATGNESKGTVSYPAAYPNVMGVGGTSDGKTRTSMSNYGAGLDVLANWNWYTTSASGGYLSTSGTSIASPQVAGLAALVWELAPSLNNAQVMQLIRDNTNRADGKWDTQTGYGIIDMGKTLAAAERLGGGSGGGTAPATPPAKDTVAPVLTLKGDAVIEIVEGGTYTEPGYTATDDVDGDITHKVTVSGVVASAYAGEYRLTYSVSDKAGNESTAARTVIVTPEVILAKRPPTITQVGSNPIILHVGGTPYTEQGAKANDALDGDLTSFVTTSGSVDTSRAGAYNITYSITNTAGLTSTVTREVRVLEPTVRLTRTPFSYSDQEKAGAKFNYSVMADASGMMNLSVGDLTKTTVRVKVIDSTGSEVFSKNFPGNGNAQFSVAEGACNIEVSILEGNGKVKFTVSGQTPEVILTEFAQKEIPTSDPNLEAIMAPQGADSAPIAASSGMPPAYTITRDCVMFAGLLLAIGLLIKKHKSNE